ncbi:MAG: relaxase/mobilization nuclease domain-containing protein [Clostridiales bacterium]|nr:relaxase/mobilization nuclease domain-containing protein [Clostridiales bacterium]
MAILKHVSERNSDYGAAQRYLLFEHDEKTGKPQHDDHGNIIPREGIIQSGINCDPFTFNTECIELNRVLSKNMGKKDVKAHHYIISFDPRDTIENGLTTQKAHGIATAFAEKFFAGHQALIVMHPDGHNRSGNIHVHIVINSLRKENVPWQDFMERPIDALAGYKHHQTRQLLSRMQDYLNEVCVREHLHTVDFSTPADKKVTDREYKARQRGQAKLDAHNAKILRDGLYPRTVDFATIKDQIREAIDNAIKKAQTEEEFRRFLQDKWNIAVKESRGIWSYIHQNRERPIRGRSLGRAYEKEAVLNRIAGIEDVDHSRPEYAALPKIFLIHSDLKLVVDIQNCVKAQQSRAYARKVEISNIQQIARSVAYIQEHGIETLDELKNRLAHAEEQYKDALEKQQKWRQQLNCVNEVIHYLGQYLSTKKIYTSFIQSTDRGAFRIAHRKPIEKHDEALTFLKNKYANSPLPQLADLRTEKNILKSLILNHEKLKKPQEIKTLHVVYDNIIALFRQERFITQDLDFCIPNKT